MINRETQFQLGLAIVMFVIAALVTVAPYWAVGVITIILSFGLFARVQLSEDWHLADAGVAFWLFLVGGTIAWTPAWGVPLLLITGGVQLYRALGQVGMAIDLALVALVAWYTDSPTWTIVLLLGVAVGKILWLLRDYLNHGNVPDAFAT